MMKRGKKMYLVETGYGVISSGRMENLYIPYSNIQNKEKLMLL